jgi:hypothetical protein
VPQPNFQYGKSIFGRIDSFKKAAPKKSNYELLATFGGNFECFHGQRNIVAYALKSCIK